MAWRLIVRLAGRDHRFVMAPGTVVVGAAEDCAVRIADPTVSRHHARFVIDESGIALSDLGSRNGTLVDGRRIGGAAVVDAGAVLGFGDVRAVLERMDADDECVLALGVAPEDRAVQSGVAGPAPSTLATAPRIRFCTGPLPRLIRSGVETASWRVWAGEVLAALVECGAAGARLARAAAIVAEAGTCGGPAEVVPVGDCALSCHAGDAADLPGLRAVAELARDLLNLRATEAGASDVRAAVRTTVAVAEYDSRDPRMIELYRQADIVARSTLGVLIEGETGTGKERFARHLHVASGLPAERFIALNCSAIPRDLMDAELFGIEAGVATGVGARAGKFELADGGTLFLDEIADMAPETQARLLRVLQEGEVYRIGAQRPRSARARIVAACNRPLERLVEEGLFRLDLYHRIADWVARLPPLREREADIVPLATAFLEHATAARGVRVSGWSGAALGALRRYPWPGNVRELEREMARIALFVNSGEVVDAALLKPAIREARREAAGADAGLEAQLAAHERRIIEAALRACDGHVARAAERLGVGKSTLYRRIEALGIR